MAENKNKEKNDKEKKKQENKARLGGMTRLWGLVRKEFFQIMRDPSSIMIAFLMPVFLLLLFGYGVSLDAEDVPVAIVTEGTGNEIQRFTAAFDQSRYFEPTYYWNMKEAVDALMDHRVDGIIRIREDFSRDLVRGGGAPIQVILNGVDANTARLVSGYVEGIWAGWLEDRARMQGTDLALPVELHHRIWYNSEVRSRNFLVPGLIAVIMTLIGALLTAMVMAREWERGTMESLLVTPVRIREVIIGKLIPYFVMGMGGMALSVAMAVWLFHVPLRGSLWLLILTSALFLLVALGMGLLISTAARNQFVAGQIAIIVTYLPAFLLSGFLFDIGSMPEVVQWITYIVGARYFVAILQSLFLAGNIPSVVLFNSAALMLMAALFLGLSRLKTRKRLD